MRQLTPMLLASALCVSLAADTTGGLTGKVVNKGGQPIPNAVLTLKRTDISYVKEIKSDAKGKYIQVGLNPVEYDLTVHADGFADLKDHFKVPLGEIMKKDFTLLTHEESKASAPSPTTTVVPDDPGASLDDAGSTAANEAIGFYNKQEWKQAEPLFEKAYNSLGEALSKTKDEAGKQKVNEKLNMVVRPYALVLYEVGKSDKAQAKLDKAKPMLEKALETNPKDVRVLTGLAFISKNSGDKEATAKYQATLDEINGPRPENAYNDGVAAYNANKFKEAKEFILKALQIDPKFADSYYMLGLIETNNNNLKAAKDSFKKCLELAPAGKHSAECREFIKAL